MDTWESMENIQPIVVKMLRNSIKKNRVAHAYLFEGPKGIGKMDMAILLAKNFFCLGGGEEPCNECINCRKIDSRNHTGVFFIEPDGQSIKKQQIQDLQAEFTKKGVDSNKKLYIINYADKMTTSAANSLLKFLEEPPEGTMAILITEQSHRLLQTILSRCQEISFRPLSKDIVVNKLLEQDIMKPMALLTAQLTNDVEEAISFCGDDWFVQIRPLVIKLYEAICSKKGLLFIHEKWIKHFQDREQQQIGLDVLLLFYKDILYTQSGEENVVFCDQGVLLQSASNQISSRKVTDTLLLILDAKKKLSANMNPQLVHEELVIHLQEG